MDWLERAFAVAAQQSAAAVVIIMQADMWDGSPLNGFDSTVQKIAASTLAFGKPVLLVEGDSHVYKTDNPLAAGDPVHGVTTPVPNLTRVVVQGSTTARLSSGSACTSIPPRRRRSAGRAFPIRACDRRCRRRARATLGHRAAAGRPRRVTRRR